jgi:hypothetical protein
LEGEVKTVKMQSSITWTPDMLARFKPVYKRALKEQGKDATFEFDGHQFLVAYAGYLIEYLEGAFAK